MIALHDVVGYMFLGSAVFALIVALITRRRKSRVLRVLASAALVVFGLFFVTTQVIVWVQ